MALKNSRGIALTVVIFIVGILLAITAAGLLFSGLGLKTTGNFRTGSEAFYIAEAGVQVAIQELDNNNGTNDFATVNLPLDGLFNNTPFGSGNYTVDLTLVTATPRIIGVTSTGTVPANSAKKVVRARLEQVVQPAPRALLTDGTLELPISGNINLMGTCGGAHSNGAITISGNPGAQKTNGFTSSGTMTISGNPCIGSDACDDNPRPDAFVIDTNEEKAAYAAANQNQSTIPMPTINPADFAQRVADLGALGNGYILHDDGTVTQGSTCGTDGRCSGGTVLPSPPTGWSFSSGQWTAADSNTANGVFYAETRVNVNSNAGTVGTPWQATIIARDSVQWSSNPVVKPYPATDSQLQNILLVTGNDLSVSGNLGMAGQGGAVLVHQQISFSGNPTIHGYVISSNGQTTWLGDPFPNPTSGGSNNLSSSQTVSGNVTIFYNCENLCSHPACGIPRVRMVAGSWTDF